MEKQLKKLLLTTLDVCGTNFVNQTDTEDTLSLLN
ncbi:MAG: hypothetical protein ACD_52C00250G0001 [uncultured bacterium]|nr:MAG: hypothetical protein ACD_52C00250G0001 [uncultured bacterium]